MGLDDWLDVGGYFDWITPLLGLVQVASGRVDLEGPVEALMVLQDAGIACGAPQYAPDLGTYLFTVRKQDVAKARRVCARAGVEVW